MFIIMAVTVFSIISTTINYLSHTAPVSQLPSTFFIATATNIRHVNQGKKHSTANRPPAGSRAGYQQRTSEKLGAKALLGTKGTRVLFLKAH